MRSAVFMCVLSLWLIGCSASPQLFPSLEESRERIAALRPALESVDSSLAQVSRAFPATHNITTKIDIAALDRLLDAYASRSTDDIKVRFLATRPFWKEEKSLLGISYTNVANIDTGFLTIDIKKFRLKWAMNNTVNAEVEIEGKGTVSASGRYMGIPATALPMIHFYLNETVLFDIAAADSERIVLKPKEKNLLLKTRISMILGQWEIPYYKEIPLRSTDIIAPITVPTAMRSEIVFPIPAAEYGSQKYTFQKRGLELKETKVSGINNTIIIQSNITLTIP